MTRWTSRRCRAAPPITWSRASSTATSSRASCATRSRARDKAAVADSEARYRQLFERVPSPMWVYDRASLEFLAVNDAAVDHYGYSRNEFLKMTLADMRPLEDLEELKDFIFRADTGLV